MKLPGCLLSDTESGKQPIEHLLHADRPRHLAQGTDGEAKVLRHEFGEGSSPQKAVEVIATARQTLPVALSSDEGRVPTHSRCGVSLDRREEGIETFPRPG